MTKRKSKSELLRELVLANPTWDYSQYAEVLFIPEDSVRTLCARGGLTKKQLVKAGILDEPPPRRSKTQYEQKPATTKKTYAQAQRAYYGSAFPARPSCAGYLKLI